MSEQVERFLRENLWGQFLQLMVSDLKSLWESREFRLDVICHTLADVERQAAIETISSRTQGCFLFFPLGRDGRMPPSQFQIADVLNGPVALMNKCEEILRESTFVERKHPTGRTLP
jgi:hypothetical protein